MAEKFTGNEGAMISLSEARTLISNYKTSSKFRNNQNVKGIFFGKDHLMELLNQKGCKGIRVYYGIEKDGSKHVPRMVLVGADEKMNDMINGKILDRGRVCPIWCSTESSLYDIE